MRQSHLMLSNAAIMWASRVFQLVPQLILVPYLISTVGEAGYGIYALIWSLLMSIDQLEKSLQSGVVKYSAGFLAQGRIDEVSKVVSSSSVYSLLLAVVACAGMLVVAAFSKGPAGQLGSALVAVAVMVLFIVPLTPYIAVIQSRQCYYVAAIAETSSKYLSLLAVVVWFHVMGPSVKALIIIMAGALFLSRLAQIPVAYRFVPGLRNRPSSCSWKHFRQIVTFGGAVVLISLCLMLNSTGIRWMMGALVSTSFVAHLAIILMPKDLISGLVLAATITVMPATSAFEATGNRQMLKELMIRGMRYTTILALAALLAASLLIRDVLTVWVGRDYIFLAPYALAMLATGSFALSTSTSHHMLKGLGWLRATTLVALVAHVLAPVALLLLVFHTWHDAYLAVTVGLGTGHIVYGSLHIALGLKAVGADVRAVFIRVYAQPLLVLAGASLIVLGLLLSIEIDGLLGRACVSALGILLFFGGCYTTIATPAERHQLREVSCMAFAKVATLGRITPMPPQP